MSEVKKHSKTKKVTKIKDGNSVKTKVKNNSLDNIVHLTSIAKETIVRSKDSVKNLSNDGHATPEEYAEDNIHYAVEDTIKDTVHLVKKTAHKVVQKKRKKESNTQANIDENSHNNPSEEDISREEFSKNEPIEKKSSERKPKTKIPSGQTTIQNNTKDNVRLETDTLETASDKSHQQNDSIYKRTEQSKKNVEDKQHEDTENINTPSPSQKKQNAKSESHAEAIIKLPANENEKIGSIRKKTVKERYNTKSEPLAEKASGQKQRSKASERSSVKTIHRDIKTREQTLQKKEQTVKTAFEATKSLVNSSDRTAKATLRTAKMSQITAEMATKTVKKSGEAARIAATKAYHGAVPVVKATEAAVKGIIASIRKLVAALGAGGSVAAVVVLIICALGLITGSCFGIFFSGEDTGNGMSIRTAMEEINKEYTDRIEGIRNGTSFDVLEISGSRAAWPDILAIYAVKISTDPNNPQEIASMNEEKEKLLEEIFWEMTSISESKGIVKDSIVTETDDGKGNIIEKTKEVTQTHLYITVSHKTVEEMAAQYNFNEEQKTQLVELRTPDKQKLWSQVLYGYTAGNEDIVAVALSQIGNVGGEAYWSWYGFNSRVEWCACFVSWCANETGYIEIGVIPKFAGCGTGVDWFVERGQWQDNSYTPNPGDIIFFDWANDGQDGGADHVGIVEKVENGIVYTVEGNTSDSCKERRYLVGYYEILGYGVPCY